MTSAFLGLLLLSLLSLFYLYRKLKNNSEAD